MSRSFEIEALRLFKISECESAQRRLGDFVADSVTSENENFGHSLS
jgi:hypothetical protein